MRQMRPFDFMVPFWGERYRDYFVDLSLPSLLAPNNLCLLHSVDGHRLLIATTREDWRAIERLPIMARVGEHATPIHIEVSDPPADTPNASHTRYAVTIQHQHRCLKKLFEAAYPRRGYGVQLYPDVIYSDGMVASMIKRANAGQHVVIGVAMRQVEEDALDHLRTKGYLPTDARLSLSTGSMNIPQREMADITASYLHPEMDLYDHGRAPPPFASPFHYWRIPEGRGMILHTFYTPMLTLIDFAVVPPNHADCLDNCDIAKDYVSTNFTDRDHIGVVQDSDEWACISLTPRTVNWSPSPQTASYLPRWCSDLRWLSNMRESMRLYAGDDATRRDLFRMPIRWHSGDRDAIWAREEERIRQLIDRAVGDYYAPGSTSRALSRHRLIDQVTTVDVCLRRVRSAVERLLREGRELLRRLWLAACGNDAARRWFLWRMQVLWRRLQGHTTHPPRPEVP